MSADPLLILQLQRMGDIILTFPLLAALHRAMPNHPLWVVAAPAFSEPLMPIAPEVVFFSPDLLPQIAHNRYRLAVNLSSGPKAAACMAKLQADVKIGPAAAGNGLRIHGDWSLYRASLTQNNRHNRFHWSDLYALDLAPMVQPRDFGHPLPVRRPRRDNPTVGLVLGASEQAKRPDAEFWARLAVRLVREGIRTVFLGGDNERNLGAEVARKAKLPLADMCGRLSVSGLARTLRTLDLCVSPDTGPMHLADWLGVPVLNLSMGPVNARETGPSSPGQTVQRAAMSCVGCWHCRHLNVPCRQRFTPAAVARTVLALLEGSTPGPETGLALLRTSRDANGLHRLVPVLRDDAPSCRERLEEFWQATFLARHGQCPDEEAARRLRLLAEGHPLLHRKLRAHLQELFSQCAAHAKRSAAPAATFWQRWPPCIRLLSGYLQMTLQNGNHDAAAWQSVMGRLEHVLGCFG